MSGVGTDTYSYNGLGLRVGKTDSTGSYLYVCDGTSPGSPVLIDGRKLYTPGLSESLGGSSSYYDFDRLGNLWTVDGTSKNQLAYEDFSGFGTITAIGGSNPSPFKFSGGNGCQTEADTGLVLMGHRYYDSRQGRFISQDPAGDGDNWYAYAGNSPVNKTDPLGLTPMDGPGSSAMGSPGYMDIGGGTMARAEYEQNFDSFLKEAEARQDFYVAPPGSSFYHKSAKTYNTATAAAIAAIKRYYSTSNKKKIEYGGPILENMPMADGSVVTYYLGPVVTGTKDSLPVNQDYMIEHGDVAADWHTHPSLPGYDSNHFSSNDINVYKTYQIDGYVGTPNAGILEYDESTGQVNTVAHSSYR